jgi:hypothetical protein
MNGLPIQQSKTSAWLLNTESNKLNKRKPMTSTESKKLIDPTLPTFSLRQSDGQAVQGYVDLAGNDCKLEIG